MKKFLVLFNAPVDAFSKMTEMSDEDKQKEMEGWTNWMNQNQTSFVDQGAPVGKNTRQTAEGSTDTRNEIGGYSIMQAESKAALQEIIASGPHFSMPGTYIEIMEIVEM